MVLFRLEHRSLEWGRGKEERGRWPEEILHNDANYCVERQRQTHISLSLVLALFSPATTLERGKIYRISRNWVNGREEVVVKKYRFAFTLLSLHTSLFNLSPGTDERERGFLVYIYSRKMPEDRHDHMDAATVDYILFWRKNRKHSRKQKNSEQVGPMNESAANNGEKKIDQEIDPFRCRAQWFE